METITYLAHAHKMPVSAEQALLASKHVSAVAYVETTSAYVSKAVPEAFELAAQAALGLLNSKKNLPKKVRDIEVRQTISVLSMKLFLIFTEKIRWQPKSITE